MKTNNVHQISNTNSLDKEIDGKTLTESDIQILNELNSLYAHTTSGCKHCIVSLRKDAVSTETHSFESLTEFKNRFLHEPKLVGKNRGDAWLKWSGKKYFPDGLAYCPDDKLCPTTQYNLYTGFAVKPKEGEITPFIDHIHEVICDGQTEVSHYLLQYFAHMIQKPQEKPSVAVVMKSVQGAGKGSMMEPFKQILGANVTQTNGAYLVAGRFNNSIGNRILVFADEVELTNKKIADKLKALISEKSVYLERKGFDAVEFPNYLRFIFASNHDHVLLAGIKERRYLVLEPSDKFAQDKAYFNRYFEWLDNDGAAHLLHYLQNMDISDFDPRRAPITKALQDEILANLSPQQEYLIYELSLEKPFGACRVSPNDVFVRFDDFLKEKQIRFSMPQIRSIIGKLFSKLGIPSTGKRGVNLMYQLPEPETLRKILANRLGVSPDDLL
ncbi:primase-helicase family protein [Aliiglaciecola lipolytica]|uniref:NrS-1 polymerase-like helicase domain-containing protein n=1 Tax=Aliiglaciecola lipolytica E3 TaxID=1127673 RepID=K6YFS8_9ALTE|nr:primase-helicase family protein [Aliiglaciecola lipolytica]GAC15488.1 hypothetical protein GLIP_2867 [Aliiglaciecola lipolytica E3]